MLGNDGLKVSHPTTVVKSNQENTIIPLTFITFATYCMKIINIT